MTLKHVILSTQCVFVRVQQGEAGRIDDFFYTNIKGTSPSCSIFGKKSF